MSDPKKPAARICLHQLSATIWCNPGQNGPFYTAQFQKSFRDDEGNWQHTNVFAASQLLLLAKLADLAETEIRKLRANDRADDQPDDQPDDNA